MSIVDVDRLLINYEQIWSDPANIFPERPLRLVDVKSFVNDGKLILVPAETQLQYCIISYTWNTSNRKRDSKYLLEQISPFTVEGLKGAIHVCHRLKHDYLWIDALCIDQRRASKEKAREIPNMGKYYRNAVECVIFPEGLHLDAEILPKGKLPRWFYRSWTLQECILPRKKTFIFHSSARHVFEYSSIGGPIHGEILDTQFGSCITIDSYALAWLLRLTTDQWFGDAPFKADQSEWKEVNRESAFLLELNCTRKGDILQRAMFRASKYKEDQIYALISAFEHVQIEITYGVGLEEVLRRLAEAVNNDELAYLLLTNWYPTDRSDGSRDISALPTFERRTAAVWFNMGKVYAKCKYVRSEGVHISSRILHAQLRIIGPCDESMYNSISTHSDLEIQDMELSTSAGIIKAYGRCLHDLSDVIVVVLGKFDRIQSTFTGAVCVPGTLLCCLICEGKDNNRLQKIGICICVFDDIDEKQVLHPATILLG